MSKNSDRKETVDAVYSAGYRAGVDDGKRAERAELAAALQSFSSLLSQAARGTR